MDAAQARSAPAQTAGGSLISAGFLGLLSTQFLTALNDNVFRWLVIGIGKQHVSRGRNRGGADGRHRLLRAAVSRARRRRPAIWPIGTPSARSSSAARWPRSSSCCSAWRRFCAATWVRRGRSGCCSRRWRCMGGQSALLLAGSRGQHSGSAEARADFQGQRLVRAGDGDRHVIGMVVGN